jgi:hypothetical protein
MAKSKSNQPNLIHYVHGHFDMILYDIIHGRIVSLWSLEGIDGAFCSEFYRDTNQKYKHGTHSYQISLKSGDTIDLTF